MTATAETVAVSAFGERAQRIASRLPEGINAVITDVPNLGRAYVEASSRRMSGQRFYGMILADDPRTEAVNIVAKAVLRSEANYDTRYTCMVQIGMGALTVNGKPLAESWDAGAPNWGMIAEFLAFSDATLVRSATEFEQIMLRMSLSLASSIPRPFQRIVQEPVLPAIARRVPNRPTVGIWAANTSAMYCALAGLALEELHGDVFYVSSEPLPGSPHRWLSPHDPGVGDALGSAGAIVCVDPFDPADAIAFARLGIPVVAPKSSGCHEYVSGAVWWDGFNGLMLLHAVASALASDVSIAVEPPALPPLVHTPLALTRSALPLVSIITPTYNRPEWLKKVLTCLAAQTYPNIESIVVNDAGQPVDDIVAEFPFVRLINAEKNGGGARAVRIGFEASSGAYVTFLPDDDWFYPDHVERLMEAILRTGAAIANSRAIVRYLKHDADGNEVTWGMNNSNYMTTATTSAALVGTGVAHHQMLQRRDTFDPADVGWFLLDSVAADQEYHMRLTQRYSFVFVNHVTCEFRDHPANQGKACSWWEAMDDIYTRVFPVHDRPMIEAQRRAAVESLKGVPLGENCHRPSVVFEPPIRQ